LVEINNVSPLAYKFLSNALSAANDQTAAELAAKRASKLAPNSTQLTMNLWTSRRARGKALDALGTARHLRSPTRPSPRRVVAEALLRMKRTGEAETLSRKDLLAKPDRASHRV